jgi:hypothetical protein
MAQQIIVNLVDDVDGSEAEETVTFGIDGTTYEIDLSAKNAAKLRKALEPFADKGRKVAAKRGKVSAVKTPNANTGEAAAIRVWAAANGIEVPAKGRIPADVREKYDAHNAA